jgi:LmbE family N-acetylglucosaminyl deacetylase
MKKVLILAPHTDDGELGCGATINRLIDEGHEVYYIAFSTCEESVPAGFPINALEIEVKEATKVLGIKPENLIIKKYPVRKFNSFRQDILEDLVVLRGSINPEIIFMPCSNALHQDHHTIYNEGIRAFKHHTIYGYDLPWDTVEFRTTSFFKLEKKHVEKKKEAIRCYKTQNFRGYVNDGFLEGLARVRGAQIAVEYAEAFELIRLIN